MNKLWNLYPDLRKQPKIAAQAYTFVDRGTAVGVVPTHSKAAHSLPKSYKAPTPQLPKL